MSKVHVKKGDTVLVLSGKEGVRGQTAKVKSVNPSASTVVLEGLNIKKRAVRPNQFNPQGGFVESEAPLHSSKVMPVCPSCSKATRVRHKVLESGKKVRACAKCGAALDAE